ncbi:hypothetical protein A8146_06945 [Mesorhizobium loti]|nr:hypothetical protein [Mesorhizobium erdmanii]OBQ67230.1 hypothetical protein A8146_06945 [Mesorhizobium loti]
MTASKQIAGSIYQHHIGGRHRRDTGVTEMRSRMAFYEVRMPGIVTVKKGDQRSGCRVKPGHYCCQLPAILQSGQKAETTVAKPGQTLFNPSAGTVGRKIIDHHALERSVRLRRYGSDRSVDECLLIETAYANGYGW